MIRESGHSHAREWAMANGAKVVLLNPFADNNIII